MGDLDLFSEWSLVSLLSSAPCFLVHEEEVEVGCKERDEDVEVGCSGDEEVEVGCNGVREDEDAEAIGSIGVLGEFEDEVVVGCCSRLRSPI